MAILFTDRHEAGRLLAGGLKHFAHRTDVVVLALPRGGVPVAAEVAKQIAAPLDVFIVRKLGVPGQPELAMGAIASGDVRILNQELIDDFEIDPSLINRVTNEEKLELEHQEELYRLHQPPFDCHGKNVILIDDGLATGASMSVALEALKRQKPGRMIVAVPVGSIEGFRRIRLKADEVVCVACPDDFDAVGAVYENFSQVSDEEVLEFMAQQPRLVGDRS
jgi:predicted phosphoribosyltransferase